MPLSVLINPSHVKFFFSCSVLDQVAPAHSPRKTQFNWGMTPTLLWKNKSFCCDLRQVLRGKEKAKSTQVLPRYTPVTHTYTTLLWKLISKKLLKGTSYSMIELACQVCWHSGSAQILAWSLLSRYNPQSIQPPKKWFHRSRRGPGKPDTALLKQQQLLFSLSNCPLFSHRETYSEDNIHNGSE